MALIAPLLTAAASIFGAVEQKNEAKKNRLRQEEQMRKQELRAKNEAALTPVLAESGADIQLGDPTPVTAVPKVKRKTARGTTGALGAPPFTGGL